MLAAHGMKNRKELSEPDFEKLVQSMTRLQFKDCQKYDKVLVKLPFLANPLVKVINKVLIEANLV